MDRFPRRADALEHEGHPSRHAFRCSFVILRLRPKTGNSRSIPSKHRH